jgi:natural product precursor
MKKIKSLKLNALIQNELEKNEMNSLGGGTGCMCGCYGNYQLRNSTSSSYTQLSGGGCMCDCNCGGDGGMQNDLYSAVHNWAISE